MMDNKFAIQKKSNKIKFYQLNKERCIHHQKLRSHHHMLMYLE